ncbi:FUSC family protein [Klebsiella pneumoniae subsp. pneumoniae]|nr:FUSC family protein [Klebsiella pneumoniae subsp. pneumoniae]
MMMIPPSTSDGSNTADGPELMHAGCWSTPACCGCRSTTDAIPHRRRESVIGQILTMNLLRIQAFWSHYRFRRQNPLLNYLLHQQLRMTSVISSLRRMLLRLA